MAMQNSYQGPPKDFAMVVPVPVVLKKRQVKTLDDGVFERIDSYSAPRLVEYWEQDPCPSRRHSSSVAQPVSGRLEADSATSANRGKKKEKVVKVEAEFNVGEYEIAILSSEKSTALEQWLHDHDYNIPDGSAPYLQPYIQQGMYFFVARVNIDKVEFQGGRAVLSPLRFHYQSKQFKLPVRLGLINSKGSQDLIVFTLSPSHRYRVANYPNVTIPTNIAVNESVKQNFGGFYTELFNRVMAENPKAVVTEYTWQAGKCDPCATPPVSKKDLMTLGADIVAPRKVIFEPPRDVDVFGGRPPRRGPARQTISVVDPNDWVITRLHTAYTKETLGKDLVFEKAPPIRGGRGMPRGVEGVLPDGGAKQGRRNNFQGRYVVLHHWDGKITCEDPRHGYWGGPPGGPHHNRQSQSRTAGNLAFTPQKPEPLSRMVEAETVDGLKEPVSSYDEPLASFPKGEEGEDDESESDQ
jgi:hypothetical protein